MAHVVTGLIQRRESSARLSARRLGIDIDRPRTGATIVEQEATDTM